MATYTVQHTRIGDFPHWYHLDCHGELQPAIRRARNYALDQGGYVCVKDEKGATVFGTDPIQLDRAISKGLNKDFPRETARRRGC